MPIASMRVAGISPVQSRTLLNLAILEDSITAFMAGGCAPYPANPSTNDLDALGRHCPVRLARRRTEWEHPEPLREGQCPAAHGSSVLEALSRQGLVEKRQGSRAYVRVPAVNRRARELYGRAG